MLSYCVKLELGRNLESQDAQSINVRAKPPLQLSETSF